MGDLTKRDLVSCAALIIGYCIMVGIALGPAKRPDFTGHTTAAPYGHHGVPYVPDGHNYMVNKKERRVRMIIGAWQYRDIIERDGKIAITFIWLARLYPVRFYQPPTPTEEALWRQYFS